MLTPDQQTAVLKIARAAVECERSTGCPAELTAAQAIFESSYLRSAPGNNCFGIKAGSAGAQGTQYCLTSEYLDGAWKQMPLAFAVYPDLAACFADHARLIQSGVYLAPWQRYQRDHDLDAYIRGVAAFYATDPAYGVKIGGEAHSSTVAMAVQQIRSSSIT